MPAIRRLPSFSRLIPTGRNASCRVIRRHAAPEAEPFRPSPVKVKHYLEDHELNDVEIQIMSPLRAIRYTLERVIRGKDTISVTGNILRDYLTDLFPIMELGTSAETLSIAPLTKGGSLLETGVGGPPPNWSNNCSKRIT